MNICINRIEKIITYIDNIYEIKDNENNVP